MTRILGNCRSAIVASRRVRRPQDDNRAPRPPHPSLRDHRNRQRELALQTPRLSATPACPGGQTDAMGRTARELAPSSSDRTDGVPTMPKPNDLSRSPVALDENSTLIAVIEMSLASWLLAGRVPGVHRSPLRKLDPHPEALLARLHQWRDDAIQAGRTSRWRMRLGVMASGWRDGSARAALRVT